jgi:hypothetical protein
VQFATVAKLRLSVVRAARSTQNDTIATQLHPQVQSRRSDPIPAAPGVSEAEAELQATTAAEAQPTVAEGVEPGSPTAAAAQPSQQHVQAPIQQETGRWQLQQWQGLLSGPCLIAAGALACSFISLQVGCTGALATRLVGGEGVEGAGGGVS